MEAEAHAKRLVSARKRQEAETQRASAASARAEVDRLSGEAARHKATWINSLVDLLDMDPADATKKADAAQPAADLVARRRVAGVRARHEMTQPHGAVVAAVLVLGDDDDAHVRRVRRQEHSGCSCDGAPPPVYSLRTPVACDAAWGSRGSK